mgnify:CR=1 FL=1
MIQASNISLRFGKKALFEEVNIKFTEGNCYGIIGANGAGKSTFLKILSGELEPTTGEISLGPGERLSVLEQDHFKYDDQIVLDTVIAGNQKLYDIMKEKDAIYAKEDFSEEDGMRASELEAEFATMNGWEAEADAATLLNGLGIATEVHYKQMSELPDTDKVKVLLARALLGNPDILLLDEPTNHLDLDSIRWLEEFLIDFENTIIVVSHDRYFLDKIVTKVIEIENTQATIYHGNYSYYAQKREEVRLSKYRAYMNQQAEIKHQEEVIAKLKQFNREKSIKRAESREKMLDKMERLEKPQEIHDEMRLTLTPDVESGNDVLLVEGLSKSFDGKTIFSNVNIDIKRGERVALIGNNGTGKTTILKIINQLLPKDSGKITLGAQVHIGYYDQEHQVLHAEKTIFDELQDTYPQMNNTRVRNVLAAFLFTGEDVFKKIADLSGGERGRVSLAKLMLSNANFLILDEPTNHLDITSKEILENALNNYVGTILYVSHDRYFINQTATRILDLSPNGITSYIGNYDYYIEQQLVSTAQSEEKAAVVKEETETKKDWKRSKEEQARERKRQNDIKKTETRIEELEQLLSSLEEEMSLPENATNVAKLTEITTRQAAATEELEALYETWESLSEA